MIQASTEASGSIWRRSGPSRANGCDPAGVARRSGGSPRWPLQVDHDLSADELSQQPGGTLVRGCRPYEGDEGLRVGPESQMVRHSFRILSPGSGGPGREVGGDLRRVRELHFSREQASLVPTGNLDNVIVCIERRR
jgi:hypothetical protein